jgi:hypothetical protein
MNGDTGRDRGRSRCWSRRAARLAVTVGVGVLAVACSGSPSSTGSGGSSNAGAAHSRLVAFSQCMRARGVPTFPDPLPGQVNEKFPSSQQLGVSPSRYQAAENACRHLLPNGGSGPNQAEMQQELSGMRQFSECLRAHGMPYWPDPIAGPEGPVFNLLTYHGVPISSPQGQAARRSCQRLLPPQLQTGLRVEEP